MKRIFVLVSLLLPALMMGCASDKDLQAMRADTQALERQSSERQQTVEARLQSVSDRVAQFEKSQTEARRDLARTTATLDELRIQLQRLQGDIQETQHRVRRGTTGGEGVSATKLADFETRLSELEKQFPDRKSATPPVPQQKPEQEPGLSSPAPPASSTVDSSPSTLPLPAAPAPQPPPPPPPTPRVAALPPTNTTSRPPATPSPAEANVADQLYKRALKDYQEKNYEAAVVNFKQYLKQAPKSLQAGNAQYLIGESLYAQKQYEAAIVAFDEVVQKHSQDPKVAAAMLKQGYAFAELKDARNARFFLQQVQKKYPNSSEAQQAAEKLKQLR
jgi:tol-pal system protein YbgF